MRTFDGMIGVVEEADKYSLSIATRRHTMIDILTFGHFPKPEYHHLGIYVGNDSKDYERGDNVKLTFIEPYDSILESLWSIFSSKPNIIKVEKWHKVK